MTDTDFSNLYSLLGTISSSLDTINSSLETVNEFLVSINPVLLQSNDIFKFIGAVIWLWFLFYVIRCFYGFFYSIIRPFVE
ncbi:hypothetical protein FACS1894188_12360 [Clostridia bacterium]|nr:hypothetical protein FACS1894188_12360 [Clostridia bacterium]